MKPHRPPDSEVTKAHGADMIKNRVSTTKGTKGPALSNLKNVLFETMRRPSMNT